MVSAYDFADISSDDSGNPRPDVEGQLTVLSFADVPSQTSYHSKRSASSLSQHDRELRSFPLAMASRAFFFVACAMFLWLSIDDLYWADEARSIPASVLEADDDVTWKEYRSRESGRTVGDDSGSSIGYSRTSKAGNEEDEDEITWSELREKDLNGNNRRFLISSTQLGLQQYRRQQQDNAGVSFQTPWDELPFAKQIAAALLGHDETSWNQGLPVFTDTIPWENLSQEQKNAGTTLGYNQYLWNMLRGFTANSESNAVDPADGADWGQYFWDELPADIQAEASKLGYDETLWNEGGRTFADDLFWDQLSAEQQHAAGVLGYSKETWDVYSQPVDTPSSTAGIPVNPSPATQSGQRNPEASAPAPAPAPGPSSSTSSTSTIPGSSSSSGGTSVNRAPEWRSVDWDDLPPKIKGGAIALGFTEQLWNGGAKVTTDQYFWDELSSAQQEAANTIFGYTQTTWDASNNKWQKISWDNLPVDIRSSATILGYGEDLWNSGARIDTRSYSWDELSGEQQQAAFKVFGHTEESWAGAALKDNSEGDVKNKGGGRGGGRGGADDDYVFNVGDEEGNNDVWVSKYQIVYFVASVCFIVAGVLDLIRELRAFHILMVLAGIFSLLASLWVESSLATSNIFHCFSMHFFLFQSISTILYRKHLRALLPGPCKNALWMGDISFILGAFMECVLSYFYFKDDARENLHVARSDCFAALLFFLNAAIIISVTPVAFALNTKAKPYL